MRDIKLQRNLKAFFLSSFLSSLHYLIPVKYVDKTAQICQVKQSLDQTLNCFLVWWKFHLLTSKYFYNILLNFPENILVNCAMNWSLEKFAVKILKISTHQSFFKAIKDWYGSGHNLYDDTKLCLCAGPCLCMVGLGGWVVLLFVEKANNKKGRVKTIVRVFLGQPKSLQRFFPIFGSKITKTVNFYISLCAR